MDVPASTARSYAIVGVGAVGTLYGARLQRAGHPVHFLLHRDYAHVRRHGLRVDSVDGDIVLPAVQAYAHAGDMPPCDTVLVALKTTQNGVLADILPRITRTSGTVVMLQNGLNAEPAVAALVRHVSVLGGLCFLCANRVGPGHVRHQDYGSIALGAYLPDYRSAGITPAMQRVAADLRAAGTEITLLDDLLLARWKKLTWNMPFNGLSVLLNTATDRLVREPSARALVEALMHEVQLGAAAMGRSIPDTFVAKMLADTERMQPYLPSMKLDYDAGRPMEVESIYGEPLRAAAAARVTLPRLALLHQALQFLQAQPGPRPRGRRAVADGKLSR